MAPRFSRSLVLGARSLVLGAMCLTAMATASIVRAQGAAQAPAGQPPISSQIADYRLGPDDKVRVLVYDEPDLSGEFSVNSGGTLSLPLIGEVPAVGKSVSELREVIAERYAAGYLLAPKVSIDVTEFRPYFILGEVNKPGDYPYTTDLTVSKAVATANGFTYRADQKHVFLKHTGEATETKYSITSDIPLQPGDTIRIGERYF